MFFVIHQHVYCFVAVRNTYGLAARATQAGGAVRCQEAGSLRCGAGAGVARVSKKSDTVLGAVDFMRCVECWKCVGDVGKVAGARRICGKNAEKIMV